MSVAMGCTVLALSACATTHETEVASGTTMGMGAASQGASMQMTEAPIRNAQGATVGTVMLHAVPGGTQVMVRASGLTPGNHGTHLHTVGRCDAPDFTTAGPHWNPTSKEHGMENPRGWHQGDLPNLTVGADGTGTLEFIVPVPYGPGQGMMDADGSALVIHAGADDMRTDPAGNSGARIACAVIPGSGAAQ
jgi:Cu-Zn family superoxide dismutase